MAWNLTPLQESEFVSDLVIGMNTQVEGALFGMFIVAIFFIILMILKRYPFEQAVVSSSFICFLLSAMMTWGGYLNFYYSVVFLVVLAFSGMYVYLTNR